MTFNRIRQRNSQGRAPYYSNRQQSRLINILQIQKSNILTKNPKLDKIEYKGLREYDSSFVAMKGVGWLARHFGTLQVVELLLDIGS